MSSRSPSPSAVSTALVLAALAAGCASAPARRPERDGGGSPSPARGALDEVVAEVNGVPISRAEFYRRVLQRFGAKELLDAVIEEELFVQEARRRRIRVPAERVRERVEEAIAGMARDAGGEERLAEIYAREGLGLADLRERLSREISTQILVAEVTKSLREVDDEALRAHYQETYARTRYRARHIAYGFAPRPGDTEGDVNRRKLEAFNKALRTADRVRRGADFAAIARTESEDEVTAARGGDLGAIHADSPMDPTLRRAILELEPGAVSDPVENPAGGYHVFQVTEILPEKSFADCADAMRREILEREPDRGEIEKALETLRAQSSIRVFASPEPPHTREAG